MASFQELSDIAREHGTPFYLLDREAFVLNFNEIRSAFASRYPAVVVGYSYKTNYIPYLCRLARKLGGYAEVVSRLELELALKLGYPPGEIIYNGPVKTADDIGLALETGAIVNIDTMRELETVTRIAGKFPDRPIRIGLRLNIPLVDDTGKSQLQDGLAVGRFGFSEEILKAAMRRLEKFPNVRICSLHGHTSSNTRSLWVYRTIAARLADIGARYFPDDIEFLNLGGGFSGKPVPAMGLTGAPSFAEYAETVCEVLDQYPWIAARRPRLVIEPGMAVAANALSFVTRVFEIKRSGGRNLAVVDGSIFNVKPTFHHRNHPFTVVKKNIRTAPVRRYTVVGATCMEKDLILRDVECAGISRGDFLQIDNVGAYTIVLSPPFIHPAPPVLVRTPDGYELIRRRQNFNDFFGTFVF